MIFVNKKHVHVSTSYGFYPEKYNNCRDIKTKFINALVLMKEAYDKGYKKENEKIELKEQISKMERVHNDL